MTDTMGSTGAWKVTAQTPGTQPDSNGRFVPGMTISFTTASGVDSSVFVPEAQYSAEIVRGRIAAKAMEINRISGLEG